MKELAIALAIILTLSLCGMAQAEGCNYAADVLNRNSAKQVEELQKKAEVLYGDGMDICIHLIETKMVTVGEAKYQPAVEDGRNWFQKTIDWLTFWN